MRLLRRTLAVLVGLLVLAAVAVAGLLWWSLPGGDLRADIPGLSAPVRVTLDADGIPRIRAATATDAAAALGFLHARDRMFQMELMRRAASGRLSELAGPVTLPLDRTMRVLGIRRRAEADLPSLGADTRAMLDAYAAGVNAWIARRGRFSALETVLTGAPEPWTAVDSLLWGKTMALYLSGNYRQELARAALLPTMDPAAIRRLWPAQDDTPGPADPTPAGRRADAAPAPGTVAPVPHAAALLAAIPAFPAPFTQPATASNEWAVDGSHSGTGAPLLAGDPHLAYGFPAIWYLARIDTPQGSLVGATAPGVPFLVLGHNGRIAWTFTTTGADTQDVFVETVLADGQYATPDGARPFATRTETIHVRGEPDQTVTVRESRHGPILDDVDPAPARGTTVNAVAMTALLPGDTAAQGLLALNRAGSVAEARAAASQITDPVQNLLVADRGSIALFTTGRVPVRRAGDGALPVPGAEGSFDWTGLASGDALPQLVAPASGILVNGNERTAPPGFRTFMGLDWFGDWRARRIRALLDSRSTHTVQSFEDMQHDATSAFAQAVLPRLLRLSPTDPASSAVLERLRRWDGTMAIPRAEPLLFNNWMRRFDAALAGRANVPAELIGAPSDAVARALGPDGAASCGDACDAMLLEALAIVARDFASEGGSTGIAWGDVHQATFAHPLLGRVPALGALFNWHIAQPGDDTTIFRGASRAPSWASIHGPAFRGVYDLADLDRSTFALAPGQSGHPLRGAASSLLLRWRDGPGVRIGPDGPTTITIALDPAPAAPSGR